MGTTKIEWAEKVWNPVTGCNKGCDYCYARKFAKRLQANPKTALKYKNGFEPTFHPEELETPLKWKTPRIVFAPSMGDMFDPAISFSNQRQIFEMMVSAWHHVYLVLTKYPENLLKFINTYEHWDSNEFKNVWFGVSVTTQKQADEFIPLLLNTKHENLFISIEPILEKITLIKHFSLPNSANIKWVICGKVTGKKADPLIDYLIVDIQQECEMLGIPFFAKHDVFLTEAKKLQAFPDFQFNDQDIN